MVRNSVFAKEHNKPFACGYIFSFGLKTQKNNSHVVRNSVFAREHNKPFACGYIQLWVMNTRNYSIHILLDIRFLVRNTTNH